MSSANVKNSRKICFSATDFLGSLCTLQYYINKKRHGDLCSGIELKFWIQLKPALWNV
jgi:hypothetical protein